MIFYLNYSGILSSVYESQIKTPIIKMANKGEKIILVNFQKKNELELYIYKKLKKELEEIGNVQSKVIIKKSIIEKITYKIYCKEICELIKEKKISNDEKIILHCRTQVGAYIALIVKKQLKNENIKVISDFRGNLIAEYKEYYNNGKFKKILLPILVKSIIKIDNYVVKKSDQIFCVSHNFKKFLIDNYGAISEKITIIPTCIDYKKQDFNNDITKKELGFLDEIIIVYCGGAQMWQMPDELVRTFIKIKDIFKNAKFLIISKDKDNFIYYLNKNKVNENDYKIVSCKHNEVYKYLSIADLAMLIRENNQVNSVASPTKFAEYISCNVPVVITKGIGDLDSIINKDIAIYLEDINKENLEHLIEQKNKKSFRVVIENYFDWNKKIDEIRSIYSKV